MSLMKMQALKMKCAPCLPGFGGAIKADPAEIAEWKFVTISELEEEMKDRPHIFTPWFKIEWQKFMELNLLPSVMDSQIRSKGKRTV